MTRMPFELTVENLEVRAGKRRLLSVPAFALAPGTCLGVRGPSGAGKSTFLYALAGLAADASGRVLWGETDLLALSPGRRTRFRRDHVGFVFQDFLLFEELSAPANAAIAAGFLPARRRHALRETASRRLADFGVPVGSRRAETFSGGERQRIAIARALAGEPDVILADEPTASLDADAKGRLIADLVGAVRARATTLIAVSHDAALLEAMDRVVTIEDGALAAEATVAAEHAA